MMAYDCKLCHKNFFQGYRYEFKCEEILIVVYVCADCQEGKTQKEMAQIVKQKILH
jgi:hypothetical protein